MHAVQFTKDQIAFAAHILHQATALACGNQHPDHRTIEKLGQTLLSLQRGFTGSREKIATSYLQRQNYLSAYMAYYWPVSFHQVLGALAEIKARYPQASWTSVLDLGSGPGPAAAAACVMGASRVTLVDASSTALQVAQTLLMQGAGMAASHISILPQNLESIFSMPEGPFDLAVMCHALNELWHTQPDALERRTVLLERALERIAPGGVLLLMEPSAHYASRPLLALRDLLLERNPSLRCIAPCPHGAPCPLLQAENERTCFSEWQWTPPRLVERLANLAGLDKSSLKAAWVAFQTAKLSTPAAPMTDEANPVSSSATSEQAHRCPVSLSLRGRVVSDPLRNKAGRIRRLVCTESGKLATLSAPPVTGQDPASSGSAALLNLQRGDCIEACRLEPRPGALHGGLLPDSTISFLLRPPSF
ncbi:MAG: methyltransferase domain-containing protein [Spirochaetaceae bacterium]|nr:methyltransferase domain-containing protein [Spirochaetaceae bacterium]